MPKLVSCNQGFAFIFVRNFTWRRLGLHGTGIGGLQEIRVSKKLPHNFVPSSSYGVGEILSSATGKIACRRHLLRWQISSRNKLVQSRDQVQIAGGYTTCGRHSLLLSARICRSGISFAQRLYITRLFPAAWGRAHGNHRQKKWPWNRRRRRRRNAAINYSTVIATTKAHSLWDCKLFPALLNSVNPTTNTPSSHTRDCCHYPNITFPIPTEICAKRTRILHPLGRRRSSSGTSEEPKELSFLNASEKFQRFSFFSFFFGVRKFAKIRKIKTKRE